MTGDGQRCPGMAGVGWGWQGMTGRMDAGDGFYARDLKRGALALRDFMGSDGFDFCGIVYMKVGFLDI